VRDESWTIAKTLGFFVIALTCALWWSDGDVDALTARLWSRRSVAVAPQLGDSVASMAHSDEPALDQSQGGNEVSDQIGIAQPPVSELTSAVAGSSWLTDPCVETNGTSGECRQTALGHFFNAARSARAHQLGRSLRISWYGDSVVAADTIPHEMRRRLWNEFGNGGPGFVYAMPPHRFCANESIVRQSKGYWAANAVSTSPVADGWYGPGNSSATSFNGSVRVSVKDTLVQQVSLFYVKQPKGGSIVLSTENAVLATISTQDATKTATVMAFSSSQPFKQLSLQTMGAVRLFGMTMETGAGAVVDNMGVVSVNATNFAKNQPAHFAAQVALRDADLVIIMMGANEAGWLAPADLDTTHYQSRYAAAIAPLRGRPESSCLVMSPTDQAYVVGDGFASRPVMPKLVEAQRLAAAEQGCAFFSTYDWMGGKGAAQRWLRRGLIGTDFQHLTERGAEHLGAALFDALIPVTR
jgi:hypothetical protein